MGHSFGRIAVLAAAGLVGASARAVLITPSTEASVNAAAIQSAINANPNGVVTLAEGTYPIDTEIRIDNGASLIGGSTRDKVVICQDSQQQRCLIIANSGNTVVSNLTVTAKGNSYNGILMNSGTVVDCVIRDIKTYNNSTGSAGGLTGKEEVSGGGGVNICGGVLRGCLVTRCDAQDSGGAGCCGDGVLIQDGALVENCEITYCGTTASDAGSTGWGGAVCIRRKGTLRSCLVAKNRSRPGATGVSIVGPGSDKKSPQIIVESCTIVANRRVGSSSTAAGLEVLKDYGMSKSYNVVIRNNIIWGNLTHDGESESNYDLANLHLESSSVDNNNTTPALDVGLNNLCVVPKFRDTENDNYRIGYDYCVDAGAICEWMSGAIDLDGHSRVIGSRVDLGCYEREDDGALACRMKVTSNGALDTATVAFECESSLESNSPSWRFTRRQDNYVKTTSGFEGSIDLPVGIWDATVSVSANGASASESASVDVRASVVYANANGSDEFPYASVATGARSIESAYPLVGVGGKLLVAEGSYVMSSPILIDGQNGSRIESISGPEKTIIRLANTDAFLENRNSGITLARDDAYVAGLTLVGGRIGPHYDGPAYPTFGMVRITADGAVVTNCVIRDRKPKGEANYVNLGVALNMEKGTIVDSVVTCCDFWTSGGAVKEGGVVRLTGGLADRLTISDCHDISGKYNASSQAWGDIVAVVGGAELRNSLVTGCTTMHEVPVFVGVRSGATAGEGVGGALVNCTIVCNTNLLSSATNGSPLGFNNVGGVFVNGGTLKNNIIADNWSVYGEDGTPRVFNLKCNFTTKEKDGVVTYTYDSINGVSYTLVNDAEMRSDFVTESNHNILNPPGKLIFRRAGRGDYRLSSSSSAVNAGLYLDWMEKTVDRLGAARVISHIPDLGCYECTAAGLAIRLR